MARVLGIGGIFFKSADPKAMRAWYASHLGLPIAPEGHAVFRWRNVDDPDREGATAWSLFPKDTNYFGPTQPEFMVNYIVDDLDGMLAQLKAAGVVVDEKIEDGGEYGRFGRATDPEGNRLELWEPPK